MLRGSNKFELPNMLNPAPGVEVNDSWNEPSPSRIKPVRIGGTSAALPGSNRSTVGVTSVEYRYVSPPATNTVPLVSSVAVWLSLETLIKPVSLQVLLAGSYISAVLVP